jgi:hypothetical protein
MKRSCAGRRIKRGTYTLAGQPIAMRVSGDPTSANNGIFYIHTDHLGSTTVLGKQGASSPFPGFRTRYYPFGSYRNSTGHTVTDRGYTGHRHNDDGKRCLLGPHLHDCLLLPVLL